ncbi:MULTISPECIES: NTP transferase domain-containing protein [unclassified Breznakia]|uniref:NTP transferase domain-containing protein n=1 Tax=unclassified Breznakia TaxID=2623764 RepID=UPI002473DDEA|nr:MULTISPECIES: NTP transferase domain-containing protein [unclassified Breznakia]MDH6366301.1 CTP:phosphocholine cytidylyltransferase-like protein [Breznakia sp. PH1-1]MDH6403394.1 CTP:phosphocholine cytidylyltransferase-like protein [Breznakia sp. PF1-11]MDH6411103.1 CTP:phosphocholine cytidylyltransferase-like protein [Breznakia sp. PFB1-11]MDH6413467.1 CTP:phosphocholine cytidylyltransferase-like protein [Breznakia sp. PFB1-14]MDH6416744.1 CTP:phosphocholine cytidylyltransferase-like prot
MFFEVKGAIIMAAGLSSRFAPLSFEKPKGLYEVKGEVLIERQIRQLRDVGIENITIVTGYKGEMFNYLKDKFQVSLIHNDKFNTRNNNYSLYLVRELLYNSYICSADNYFSVNPFESTVDDAYYATIYKKGNTDEWCVKTNAEGYIEDVTIGGENSLIMMGHVFFSEPFAETFKRILERECDNPESYGKLWEQLYIEHINELKMKARIYDIEEIYEFDSLDELREFDHSYLKNTRSTVIKKLCDQWKVSEDRLTTFSPIIDGGNIKGFIYKLDNVKHTYMY